jgi:ParB family transcriptional regulator, chromosome partitioning protein
VIIAGGRRTKAAIAAGLARIDVLVCDADEATDAMRSVSENLVRTSMSSVDIWRAIETLESQGWNEQAIADALALPVRTVARLKLLANLHPAMLDAMAGGSMPNEDQLRTIARTSRDEQAQVWKKHKPRKGEQIAWYEITRALSKRRIPVSAAKFDDDLARAYGVTWDDDLFAPAGEDGRTTTNVEGFFGAQQEWMQNNLPPRGVLVQTDDYGRPQLPKKAEVTYGKPGKRDVLGHYLDHTFGEVKVIAYRMPEPKQAGKDAGGADLRKTPRRPGPALPFPRRGWR